MRIKANDSCNICTEEHATGFRSAGKQPKPQITVPAYRLRFNINEARTVANHLLQAVQIAEQLEKSQEAMSEYLATERNP